METYSLHSPKNPYRVEINYNKALKGLGSVSSYGAMTQEQALSYAIAEIKRNKMGATIIIEKNFNKYPEFDWRKVLRLKVNADGKAMNV